MNGVKPETKNLVELLRLGFGLIYQRKNWTISRQQDCDGGY